MKTILLATLAMLTVVGTSTAKSPKTQTNVIAHRGYWKTSGSHENSIASIKKAVEHKMYGAEFDVWLTADNVPVVYHNSKTANGILIQNTTLADLRAKADKLPNGEVIPTLDEYLTAWNHGSTKLICEIKRHRDDQRNRDIVHETIKVMNAHNVGADEAQYITFGRTSIEELLKADVPQEIIYLNGDMTPQELKDWGVDGFDYSYKVLDQHPEWIQEARELGLSSNVWTIDDPALMQKYHSAARTAQKEQKEKIVPISDDLSKSKIPALANAGIFLESLRRRHPRDPNSKGPLNE